MKTMILAAVFCTVAAAASAQAVKIKKTPAGEELQTTSGKTLYVYDGDKVNEGGAGRSSCNDQCAAAWPPFMAKGDAKAHGAWTIVARRDGSKQWAYKGRPLYTFAKASTPETNAGNGANGDKWHIAKP